MNNEKHDIVQKALGAYRSRGNEAYERYTKALIKLINKHYPLTPENFDDFNNPAKTLRAVLSQNIGAASKAAKGVIIIHYAQKLSEASDLDLSLKEAQEVIKTAADRSVAKAELTGLFKRSNTESRYSPYFSDKNYREEVLNHSLVKELSEKCNLFDSKKPKLSNPEQIKIDRALEKYKA